MATDPVLIVSEIFYSLQGESSFAGLPCLFIRLAGCNLRCSYCDARYTYEEPGKKFSLSHILNRAAEKPEAIVEITGGEPLLQENVYPLMVELLARGRTVLLETNGSLSLARVPDRVIKIMDVKCPESGMHEHLNLTNFNHLATDDEVKFVIGSRQDYDWAIKIITDHGLAGRVRLLFSPDTRRFAASELADWILADNLPVRLQIQLHKILWPETARGR